MDSHESCYEIYITKQAEQDVADIVKYIRDTLNNTTAAQEFLRTFKHCIKSLAYFPERKSIATGSADADEIYVS